MNVVADHMSNRVAVYTHSSTMASYITAAEAEKLALELYRAAADLETRIREDVL